MKLQGHITYINRWNLWGVSRWAVWKTLPEHEGAEDVGTGFSFRPKEYLSTRHCALQPLALG
jgi:hypothetical protein